ncbi:MFS transporter, partial [Beijerinckia sp. L45]|uniref:MFS transporter n=1 Tax=Beijerinckia sp. L45 TaxID=1641855 RepID=UPI0015753C5A
MLVSARMRVFALFAFGYFVSYVFRGLNIGFAPFITHDLGLSAADLGLLTSLYFLGFAAAQIPAGVLLDWYGPRRVNAGLLLLAAAGIAVFGAAPNLGTMMLGRLMIGVGVSTCLGGAFKALALHFPARRLPLLNGLTMAIGGLGGVVVGSPLAWLLTQTGWREICFGLAAVTVGVAAVQWVGVPESNSPPQGGLRNQFAGTWQILSSAPFWKTACFSTTTQGVFYAAQSLWVGAYLRDVSALPTAEAAALVSELGIAMMAGCVSFGLLAKAFERRGLSAHMFCGIGMMLFVI